MISGNKTSNILGGSWLNSINISDFASNAVIINHKIRPEKIFLQDAIDAFSNLYIRLNTIIIVNRNRLVTMGFFSLFRCQMVLNETDVFPFSISYAVVLTFSLLASAINVQTPAGLPEKSSSVIKASII